MLFQPHSPKASISPSRHSVCPKGKASPEQNPKDIRGQEEFSSVLQQYKALVDIQIESFGHWDEVTQIHDFDSRLVKIGLVIGDIQLQLPLYGSLHPQEA